MAEKIMAHILVAGKVQGVFFRSGTKKIADKCKVKGWVKNTEDGRVEAVLEGEKENVEKVIKWAKRGPFLANVHDLKIDMESYGGKYPFFEIK